MAVLEETYKEVEEGTVKVISASTIKKTTARNESVERVIGERDYTWVEEAVVDLKNFLHTVQE